MAADIQIAPATVYEPVSGFPSLRRHVADIWDRRALVWHLARTSLKGQHYDTAFGKAWLILDPLLMAATFYVVRLVLRPPGNGVDAKFFIAHLIMGIMFFYYVMNIVQGGARCIVGNRNMILNTGVPRAVFPAVNMLTASLKLIPSLVVYFGVHFLASQPWGLSLVLLPVVLVLLTAFSLGAGLIYAPMAVFVPDSLTFLPYITRIWLYVTPVLFAVDEIPEAVEPFFKLNPLYPYFAILETIFQGQMPPLSLWIWALGWAVLGVSVGIWAFLRRERDFAIRL